MKIAVNKCFGGFSLSPIAQKRILDLKGKECHFYKQTKYYFSDGQDKFVKVKEPEKQKKSLLDIWYVFTKDYGEEFEEFPTGEDSGYWSYKDLERTDKELITAIEELGSFANGMCGNIEIIEIPDNIEWEISDYDGFETIHEKHQSW